MESFICDRCKKFYDSVDIYKGDLVLDDLFVCRECNKDAYQRNMMKLTEDFFYKKDVEEYRKIKKVF